MYRKVKEGIACLFPAMLFAILCPAGYMLMEDRDDGRMMALWLGGGILVIVTAVSRLAINKCRSFGAYLAVTAAGTAASAFLALRYRELFLPGLVGIAYLVVMAAGVFVILLNHFSVRTREAGRKKAMLLNDISWTGDPFVLEEPRLVFVLLFVLIYLLAAFYAGCPEVCDIAMLSAAVYLLLSTVWKALDRTEEFLSSSSHLANVPVRKIRRIQMGVLLFFTVILLVVSVPALLLGRQRAIRDIRGWYSYRDLTFEETWEMEPSVPDTDIFSSAVWEEFAPHETWKLPEWVSIAGWVMAGLIALGFLLLLLRMIYLRLLDFRDGYEENGDIAESLEEDVSVRIPEKSFHEPRRGTQESLVRRRYRRMIRRYLKGLPEPYWTPEEIEKRTDFPQGFDADLLHVQYEKARYAAGGENKAPEN